MLKNKVLFATITIVVAMASGLKADALAYEETGNDNFGVIDLNTGVFTMLGNMGTLLSGIGVAGGTIYGGNFGGSTLYSVNAANGVITPIGISGMTYYAMGSTINGLYALDPSGNLWSVNPSTAQSTEIGPTGLTLAGLWGVSTNSGSLYVTLNSDFYSINTATGTASLIGNTGRSFGALVSIDGTLYAGANPANQVYELNTSTGAATFISTENGAGINGSFWGLAPAVVTSSVPEPSSFSFLILGTAVLGMRRRCRRTRLMHVQK